MYPFERFKLYLVSMMPIDTPYSSTIISVVNHFLIPSLGRFRVMIARKVEILLIVSGIFLEGVA